MDITIWEKDIENIQAEKNTTSLGHDYILFRLNKKVRIFITPEQKEEIIDKLISAK